MAFQDEYLDLAQLAAICRACGQPDSAPLQHREQLSQIVFSADGKFVATASVENTARLWEAPTGNPFGQPLQHQDTVQVIAFRPDSKVVLTGAKDYVAQM